MTQRKIRITFSARGWHIAVLLLLLCGPWVTGVIVLIGFCVGLLRR